MQQKMMIYTCILYAFFTPFTIALKVHQSLPNTEIPEADEEVVSVEHSIRKRSITELSINIKYRGRDSIFILQSSEGFFAGEDTKVWIAKKDGDKFKYTLQKDVMKKVNITFYQDRETQSAIAHTINKDGQSEFNGIINSDKLIRPLNNHNRFRRDLSSKLYQSTNKSFENHVLYKREINNNANDSYVYVPDLNVYYYFKIPEIIYPEILVYVDKTLFEYFDSDIVKTVAYTLTLWNGVDLYYREMQNPIVRLNIAGIVLCQDQSVPMENFIVEEKHLFEFGKFMYKAEDQFRFHYDYDIAVLLGKRANEDILDDLNTTLSIGGISLIGKVCIADPKAKVMASAAIVTDDTKFSGIHIAAHELSHLFGSYHDGDERSQVANHCPFKNGFIMSYKSYDINQFFFSWCSKEMMRLLLSYENAWCVLNNPALKRNDKQILRILPGKYISLDEQCQKKGFKKASILNPDICLRLQCSDETETWVVHQAALEGSACEVDKFCIRGECVRVTFDKNDENSDLEIFFPSRYQRPEVYKSAEEQCKDLGIENISNSNIDVCQLYCEYINDDGTSEKENGPAEDGTLCGINGYCRDGRCIDDNFQLFDDLCREAGTSGFYRYYNESECSLLCRIIRYNVSDNFYDNDYQENFVYQIVLVQDGFPCKDNGFCQIGQCIETTITTTPNSFVNSNNELTSHLGGIDNKDVVKFGENSGKGGKKVRHKVPYWVNIKIEQLGPVIKNGVNEGVTKGYSKVENDVKVFA